MLLWWELVMLAARLLWRQHALGARPCYSPSTSTESPGR